MFVHFGSFYCPLDILTASKLGSISPSLPNTIIYQPYLDGDTKGCCVGEAWHRLAAAGGPVALGRAGALPGILKPNKF